MAWDPMPTGPWTIVAPAFAQALMAKEWEEAKKQTEYQKKRLDVSRSATWAMSAC